MILKGQLRKELLLWLKLQPASKVMFILNKMFLYKDQNGIIKKDKNSDISKALALKIQGTPDKIIVRECNFTSVETLRHLLNEVLYKIHLYLIEQNIHI